MSLLGSVSGSLSVNRSEVSQGHHLWTEPFFY